MRKVLCVIYLIVFNGLYLLNCESINDPKRINPYDPKAISNLTPKIISYSDTICNAQVNINTLKWSDINSAKEYIVYQSTTNSFDTFNTKSVENDSLVVPFDVPIQNSITYYYKIKAKNIVGESKWSKIVSLLVLVNPTTPKIKPIENYVKSSGETYTISWDPIDGAELYLIQESTDASFNTTTDYSVTETSYDFSHDVNIETKYYYHIKAINRCSDSDFSSSIDIIIEPLDKIPPEIKHTPIQIAIVGEDISIKAQITDDSGQVSEVKLHYRAASSEGDDTIVNMTGDDSTYSAEIPAIDVTTAGVEYYIEANDGTNTSRNPESGYHTINIVEGGTIIIDVPDYPDEPQ